MRRRCFVSLAAAAIGAPRWSAAQGRDDVQRFSLGVASGQPRPDSVVLWTRLMGPALPEVVPVRWQVATDERFRQIVASGEESAEAAWAHSVHAEPAGLAPGRWYW
jgi:alkaline phosphatase D